MKRNDILKITLGGLLAAVAVVIMCLGGLIPIATYVCPMLCSVTQFVVMRFCGGRIGWAWFAVVAMLSLLLGPDKEAAMVFLAIGYYPLVKPSLERRSFPIVWKCLLFNGTVTVAYAAMAWLLGMEEVISENMELGLIGLVVILMLGNLTFLLLDRLLDRMDRKLR